MTDLDTKVRSVLRDLADGAPVDPALPSAVRQRVRRRRAANAALGASLAVAIVTGTVFGVAAAIRIRGDSTLPPAGNPILKPWPGLFPATTQEEGEKLQACADAGDERCTGNLNLAGVIQGYTKFHLGWGDLFFDKGLDISEQEPGPLTLKVGQCQPVNGTDFPEGCTLADVTVERLLRHDRTGIWFVTGAHEYINQPTGAAEEVLRAQERLRVVRATAFVAKFMTLRLEGAPQALDFLSATAKSQYDRGDGGLVLFGEGIAGNGWLFDHFEVRSVQAADANSYEVQVYLVVSKDPGDTNAQDWIETLTVGPGEDYKGDLQPLVVRGAALTSASPRPAP